MGIDQIGKKGPPMAPPMAPPTDEVGSGRRAQTGHSFEVSATRAAPAPLHPEAIEQSRSALDRLRAGELDVKGYVDLKVKDATAHLAGLPPPELEAIRSALRDRMVSDPMLVYLVRLATGHAPEPPSDA